jgi:hydroxyneurosporene synthase CrtC
MLRILQIYHPTKIILVATVCWGLIGIPSLLVASAASSQVITGDTQQFREFEGLAPTMEPWETGMLTNPMPGVFEWWYWQGKFNDNSTIQMTWYPKPLFDNGGGLQPYNTIGITTPNGTHLNGENEYDSNKFTSARNTLNLTMGDSWARGDLNTVELHYAPTSNGVGADLVFTSAAPPTRFGEGSGLWYFDPSLTKISGLKDPMPFAKVKGNLTYGGQTHEVEGTGYFDKQWGTLNLNQAYDGWYWSTGHYGNYTIDTIVAPTSAEYNQTQTQAMYLAKGNGPSEVVLETMQGVKAFASGNNITAPPGIHTYPEILTMQWKNGSNSATLTLTDPEIFATRSPVHNSNATVVGYPQYFRLGGNGTLNVQWDGTNETASAPAIWEVFYTH